MDSNSKTRGLLDLAERKRRGGETPYRGEKGKKRVSSERENVEEEGEREREGKPNASLFNTECLLSPIHIYFTFLFDSAGCNSSRFSDCEVEVVVCDLLFFLDFFL